jgi:hypothetical protein
MFQMWNIFAEKSVWEAPLLILAQRVLSLLASEAHSERIISQVRGILGHHAARISDEILLNRTRMTVLRFSIAHYRILIRRRLSMFVIPSLIHPRVLAR